MLNSKNFLAHGAILSTIKMRLKFQAVLLTLRNCHQAVYHRQVMHAIRLLYRIYNFYMIDSSIGIHYAFIDGVPAYAWI
jgi:hypothetical protein